MTKKGLGKVEGGVKEKGWIKGEIGTPASVGKGGYSQQPSQGEFSIDGGGRTKMIHEA